MPKLLLLILFPLLLAACTATTVTMIKPGEIYRGYPCGSHCADFKTGYETAESQNVTSDTNCHGTTLEETTGCKAYVSEYQHTLPGFSDLNLK